MIQQQATSFAEEYIVDVSADLVNEILLLKAIHTDNFGKDVLPPHDLLNRLAVENLDGLPPFLDIRATEIIMYKIQGTILLH